jgi:hypothetical protein
MNDHRYDGHDLSECSHSWQRLDEPRPSFVDPGVYRCELCSYTYAEIGALAALVRLVRAGEVAPPTSSRRTR